MGVKSVEEIVVDGKSDTIISFYGDPRDRRVYADGSVVNAEITRVDNSTTNSMNEITIVGALTGTSYTINVDDVTKFYDKDKVEIGTVADLIEGTVVYGTYELFTVETISAGIDEPYTYKVTPSGSTIAGYTLIDSGIYLSG